MIQYKNGDWRKLIAEVRTVYDGPVGYNCDKYGGRSYYMVGCGGCDR